MIPHQTLDDYDYAAAWRLPSTVRFEVGEPRVSSTAVELPGTLINDADTPAEIIVGSWFHLSGLPPRPFDPPRPPPVPPPPARFELGRRARIELCALVSLADFIYEPGQRYELTWSFGFWTQRVSGTITVVLW